MTIRAHRAQKGDPGRILCGSCGLEVGWTYFVGGREQADRLVVRPGLEAVPDTIRMSTTKTTRRRRAEGRLPTGPEGHNLVIRLPRVVPCPIDHDNLVDEQTLSR